VQRSPVPASLQLQIGAGRLFERDFLEYGEECTHAVILTLDLVQEVRGQVVARRLPLA
jgi:hypothetical protein